MRKFWWAGKDSNLGSRWQQIYSLPPLSTWVPAPSDIPKPPVSTDRLTANLQCVQLRVSSSLVQRGRAHNAKDASPIPSPPRTRGARNLTDEDFTVRKGNVGFYVQILSVSSNTPSLSTRDPWNRQQAAAPTLETQDWPNLHAVLPKALETNINS